MTKKLIESSAEIYNPESAKTARPRVLIFSPDPDLAMSIAMLLEKQHEIVSVTRLENLRDQIYSTSPDLLLIDLFSFQGEIAKLLVVLQSTFLASPIVFLRGYRQWMPEIEDLIQKKGAVIFYKPVETLLVVDAIHQILDKAHYMRRLD